MKPTRASLVVLGCTILIWSVVFVAHGYSHVSRFTGQCCGYEGDPSFLLVFFLVFPGIFYFAGLFVILGVEILAIRALSTRKP